MIKKMIADNQLTLQMMKHTIDATYSHLRMMIGTLINDPVQVTLEDVEQPPWGCMLLEDQVVAMLQRWKCMIGAKRWNASDAICGNASDAIHMEMQAINAMDAPHDWIV